MVIVRLCGGLGNQLFIYAMGRRLALQSDVELKLDILSGFQNGYQKLHIRSDGERERSRVNKMKCNGTTLARNNTF